MESVGRYFATSSADGSLKLYDFVSDKVLIKLSTQEIGKLKLFMSLLKEIRRCAFRLFYRRIIKMYSINIQQVDSREISSLK